MHALTLIPRKNKNILYSSSYCVYENMIRQLCLESHENVCNSHRWHFEKRTCFWSRLIVVKTLWIQYQEQLLSVANCVFMMNALPSTQNMAEVVALLFSITSIKQIILILGANLMLLKSFINFAWCTHSKGVQRRIIYSTSWWDSMPFQRWGPLYHKSLSMYLSYILVIVFRTRPNIPLIYSLVHSWKPRPKLT